MQSVLSIAADFDSGVNTEAFVFSSTATPEDIKFKKNS